MACTQDHVTGATQAEQSVPYAFAHRFQFLRLLVGRLQASLLGLPNDILNFVLNISLKTFSFTRVLNSDMHFSMYKSYMFFMVRSDERYLRLGLFLRK